MNLYLLFKSLHVIAVISWMAGLLYLPRIFVYHSETNLDSQKNVFKIMERKLYNYIMRPAMILTWLFGIVLIYLNGLEIFSQLWMQLKLFLVILLSIFHEHLGKCMISLKNNSNKKSAKYFRIINEIPTLTLIFVVFLVVFKPI